MFRGKLISGLPLIVIIAGLFLNIGIVFAQHQHSMGASAEQSKDMLMPGTYTAKVKAVICGGCGPLIQKTLQGFKQVEAVTVDQKASTVQFTVKKDTMTTVAELQKALDAAAKRMGMGADYTLSDVKPK
jgi:copper chaperone CopZ